MSAEATLADVLQHLATTRDIADRMVATQRADLAGQLRTAREARGLTQQQIADLIGVVRAQVSNIERGEGVSIETLIGYAAAVGLRLTLTSEAESCADCTPAGDGPCTHGCRDRR